jgi:thiamine biosynthesis lipoprotein
MTQTITTADKLYSKGIKLMGNHFEFSAVSSDETKANECIELAIQEVRRLEQLLTTFDESSQTNRINSAAGIEAVRVDKEVFDLIDRSLKISALTQGAFDITYGSIDKSLWNFDTTMNALPDQAKAKSMVRLINYRHVILNRSEETVYLRDRGMRIGFGGIGKGYAAECGKAIMVKHGIKSGIVNAAGDLTVWGTQSSGQPWTIGVADPDRKNLPFATMTLSDMSVATSGNYEKYAIIDGRKYSHTIDPRTGYPVQGIKSVTIICRNAEIADAMATAVMVMGIKAGLHLINQIRDIACIIIDEKDVVHTSDNINIK